MVRRLGRNRDRVAGQSPRVPLTNYYRGTPKSSSPFQKKVPTKLWSARLAKAVDLLIILVVLFCAVYSLSVKPNPKVIVSSNIYRPTSSYVDAAEKGMSSFKDRNKLTFNQTDLVSRLQSQFPEIANANVELPLFGQRPVIRLSIAIPKFILENQGTRYVVADSGVVVAEAMNFADDDSLPVVVDQSGFSARVGKAVLGANQVNFINQVVLQCQRANVPISTLSLPAQAQELDLKTKDQSYLVKFYLGGDPLVETGQFLAARAQFARDHHSPSKYLDVRIAGKIFYK